MNDDTQDALIKKLLAGQTAIRDEIKCLKESMEAYKKENDKYKPYLDGALKAQQTREDLMRTAMKFIVQWSVLGILGYLAYALTHQK